MGNQKGRNIFLKLARLIWAITPFQSFKNFYFKMFLFLVRNRKTISTIEGMTFELDLAEIIDSAIFLEGYEKDVKETIEKYCRPGWTVLDIGANMGAHCLRFAKKTGLTGKVFAFEPTDYAYKKLLRNISLNPFNNIKPFQIALSDRNLEQQKIKIKSSWRSDANHIIGNSVIDFKRLDDWIIENKVEHVDLIKLDVDGNEYPVINGAHNLFKRSSPMIILEVGAWHFDNEERNPLRTLRDLGYRFWDCKTLSEYQDIDAIRGALPLHDEEMTMSLNLIAALKLPDV